MAASARDGSENRTRIFPTIEEIYENPKQTPALLKPEKKAPEPKLGRPSS